MDGGGFLDVAIPMQASFLGFVGITGCSSRALHQPTEAGSRFNYHRLHHRYDHHDHTHSINRRPILDERNNVNICIDLAVRFKPCQENAITAVFLLGAV